MAARFTWQKGTAATGKTFLHTLYNTEILHLDGESLTKPKLADLGVVNFNAAKRLGAYLRRHKIRTTRQLFATSPRDLVRVKLHGPALLWTAMLLLDAAGHNPMTWWGNEPTISTVKGQSHRKKETEEDLA